MLRLLWAMPTAAFGQTMPDVACYVTAMHALSRVGAWEGAVEVWRRDMLGSGCRPNGRAYIALITAYGKSFQWQRAVEALREMQKQHEKWLQTQERRREAFERRQRK